MAVVAKLPKMSKVVEATVEKVCEVVEVVVLASPAASSGAS